MKDIVWIFYPELNSGCFSRHDGTLSTLCVLFTPDRYRASFALDPRRA
jgi:hypothetical protein